ncbi:MAG: transposase [Gammaproteobacteria bacterium]
MGKQTYIIGRAGEVTLYDDTVSRKHAALEVEGEVLFLRDLDSRNGTYEIRDKELVPFRAGTVLPDQVFAFGECVRSVRQLLQEAGISAESAADEVAAVEGDDEHEESLDATHAGFKVPARRRLSRENIIEMLEQVEDHLEAGGTLGEICPRLGITEQRYDRWCREYGATREEREKSMAELQRENNRLRKLVADLALERDRLREALAEHGISVADERAGEEIAPPNFSVISGDTKV